MDIVTYIQVAISLHVDRQNYSLTTYEIYNIFVATDMN